MELVLRDLKCWNIHDFTILQKFSLPTDGERYRHLTSTIFVLTYCRLIQVSYFCSLQYTLPRQDCNQPKLCLNHSYIAIYCKKNLKVNNLFWFLMLLIFCPRAATNFIYFSCTRMTSCFFRRELLLNSFYFHDQWKQNKVPLSLPRESDAPLALFLCDNNVTVSLSLSPFVFFVFWF